MTKLLNVIIVLLALALVAVILYPQLQESRPVSLTFACDSTVSSLPFLIAVDESLFVENRIVPKLVFYSDPDAALDALFAGEYDVGIFPWGTVLQHKQAKGQELKVFMSEDFRQSLAVDAIVVPAKSKVKAPADLKKRRLGYPPQLRYYFDAAVANMNLAATDVTGIVLPLSQLVPALERNEIDAAWLIEPMVCALDTAAFRVVQRAALPRFVSSPFPGAAVGFTPDFLKNATKTALVRLKTSADAAAALADNKPDLAKSILGKYFPYAHTGSEACRTPVLERLVEVNKPAVSALASRLNAAGTLAEMVETESFFVEPAKLTR